jgi:hypothetical protein
VGLLVAGLRDHRSDPATAQQRSGAAWGVGLVRAHGVRAGAGTAFPGAGDRELVEQEPGVCSAHFAIAPWWWTRITEESTLIRQCPGNRPYASLRRRAPGTG